MAKYCDIKLNYLALALCILKQFSVEGALFKLAGLRLTEVKRGASNNDITEADIENMIKLRERKVPYSKIGELYNISDKAVYNRIRNYKRKREVV